MRHGITPGLTVWQTLGDGPVRGGCLHKERLIVVSGAIVYQLEKNGAVKSIGTLQSKEGRVKAISNGFQVLIVDVNGDGYRYDGTGVNRLTDPDFTRLKPTTATFHDGYGVVNRRDTGEYYISSSYDFTAWSSLDFATAEAKPDDIVEIVSDKNLLWFLGTRTLEVGQNTGNTDFPIEPLRSAFSYYGAYRNTVQRMDNTIYWFGQNENGGKAVLMLSQGADPVQVSDDRLNEWFDTLTLEEIDKAISFNTWFKGRSWYVLTFPTVCDFGLTLVFDSNSGNWFEWSTYCESSDKHGRFRADFHIAFAGLNLVGDSLSGNLYKLDATSFRDGTLPIKRTKRVDTQGNNMEYVTWAALQLELETGDGVPGQDYTMELRYSDDRGRSWKHSHGKSIGEGGEHSKRVVWRRNGRSRRRTWEFNTTAEKDIRINGAWLDAA